MLSAPATGMESVKSYSHYLAMKGQSIGLTAIDGHRPSDEERELQSEVRRTSDRMAKALTHCPAKEIASLTGYYSILHTIGYRRMPEPALLDRLLDRLLRSWRSGDRTVSESDVYGMLSDSMRNPLKAMTSASYQAFNKLREAWIRTLRAHNTFPDTDTYERYRRLALIMRDNLDPYFGGDSTPAKKAWFEKNRITEYSTVGTKILTAYRQFVCSLFPAVLTSIEMKKLDVAVLRVLTARFDLNPYDRQAYQLALTLAIRQDA